MARKEIIMEELVEVLYQWHKGQSISRIKCSVGMDRKTIRKYIDLAVGYGLSRDIGMQEYRYYMRLAWKIQEGLKAPIEGSASHKKTALYQVTIEKLMVKKYITRKYAYRILKRDYDYSLSYASFNRYMNVCYPKQERNCLRLEVQPGEEAQVDFGSAGKMYDPKTGQDRRAHAFVMTLSYSRLPFVEFAFDQGQATWVKCHIHAFEFFGGVPERIILDNLKSGILQPNTYDPVFNRTYAECGKYYGFIIDPAKCRRGDHKGKVERKIPVIRQQFLCCYEPKELKKANEKVQDWCLYEYGMDIHGTTKRKPYEVFKTEEVGTLKNLPVERFDIPLWKEARVHPDHHVVFEKSYYSMPTRFVGKDVLVRGGMDKVQFFYDGELIKTHPRACRAGSWQTDEGDYPPEKAKYLMKTTSYYENEALRYGEEVSQLVSKILGERAYRNLRKVQGIFRLGDKYGGEELNLTCKRCLYYEDYQMSTIKKVLEEKLYQLPFGDESEEKGDNHTQEGLSFIRPFKYFIQRTEEERV